MHMHIIPSIPLVYVACITFSLSLNSSQPVHTPEPTAAIRVAPPFPQHHNTTLLQNECPEHRMRVTSSTKEICKAFKAL